MPQRNLMTRFAFDPSGNRTTTGYATGSDNQMLTAPAVGNYHYEYAYDHEGNQTTRSLKSALGVLISHDEYTWDFRDRMTKVQSWTDSGGVTLVQTIDLGYDAFDHRVHQTVTNNTASTVIFDQRFVYDGTNIAAAVDGTTLTTQQVFLHGLAQNEFYAQDNVGTSSTMTLWASIDHQQTVRDVVDSSGNLLNHIKYGSFGNIVSLPLIQC